MGSLFMGLHAQNQTFYDAAIGSTQEVNGTARFMAVGGAMGALGGDASVVAYNPAGIGVYRSSELTLTGNIHWTNTSMNGSSPHDELSANLANVAYIGTWLNPKNKGLITLNFGVTYNRLKNFSREGRYSADSNQSMSQFLAYQTEGIPASYFSESLFKQFNNEELGWNSILGYKAGLFSETGNNNQYLSHYDKIGGGLVSSNLQFSEYGSTNEYGFSIGGNVANMLYWGMSFNCDYLLYSKQTAYQEHMKDNQSFTWNTLHQIEGCGFTYKVGLIVKPVNWLRIGAAFHTPTWYVLNDWSSASVSYRNGSSFSNSITDTPEAEGSFYLQSPLSAMGSLGFVLGKFGFIGIDYQYRNTSCMQLKDQYRSLQQEMNDACKESYVDTHAIRIGLEVKPIDALALRVGGGYTLPNTQADAARYYYSNDVRCDVDYYNTKESYNVTAGIGCRIGRHALDLAYIWQVNNADYVAYGGAEPVSMRSVRNQIALTYGIRF